MTEVAERLLKSSAKHSFDPNIEIDWSVGPVPGKYHMVPKRMSLAGTDEFSKLTEAQRIELSKHEIISVARVGLWFEILLMGMLASHAYNQDPASVNTQFALTEIGDETRHSVMFARWADKYGGKNYKPAKHVHALGKVFRTLAPGGPSMWAATLVAEELLDRLQREMMRDESLQPLSRTTSHIHVVEEARHVAYALNELKKAKMHWGPYRYAQRVLTALASYFIVTSLIHPDVYKVVGIDNGRQLAKNNPQYGETIKWMGEKIVPILQETGMMNRTAQFIYRKARLI